MNIVSYRFFNSLRWSAIESTLYQALFVAHHAALFSVCPASTYGMTGILFSVLFTASSLVNLGLDLLLAPHITAWSRSKLNCTSFFYIHLPPTVLALVTCISITGIWWATEHLSLWVIMSGTLITESVRKTLKNLLRLVGHNQSVALIELGTLLGYMTMVWTWYWHIGSFTLVSIFLPLLIAGSLIPWCCF